MQKTSINIFYRWKLLSVERQKLISLLNCSTGPENNAYRILLQNCISEMRRLTPQIAKIFKRIRQYQVMKDVIAIYFEDISYQDWAETRGITVDALFSEITSAMEEIDCEIHSEENDKAS